MLDPSVDWERYREASCKRFIAAARALGHQSIHDLDELAKDLYDDVWVDFLARPRRKLGGAAVAYITHAMMNKLCVLNCRGRSVRSTDLARVDGNAMLKTIASEELEPSEQVVLEEEMSFIREIVEALPAREKVAWAAVFARDPKRKDVPGGYRLAAAQLGVSTTRAKKLSLQANKRLRAAVEEFRSGRWCERWSHAIELLAAGAEGEPEFLRHAEHCTRCRLGVAHLRHQANGAARRRPTPARSREEAGSSPARSGPSLDRQCPFGAAAGRRRGSRHSRGRMPGERVLLWSAQRGDRHAEELLIESYEQLASQVCRGFFLAGGESADLLQAARIGLWNAIHAWDPDRGTGFRPFALLVMRREVMSLVTASRAYSQMLLNKACSLQAPPTSIDERRPALPLAEVVPAPPRAANDPYELAHARERLGAMVSALATLSPQEHDALRLTLNGLSHAQAGSQIGGDAKGINNALQRARRKLSAVQ